MWQQLYWYCVWHISYTPSSTLNVFSGEKDVDFLDHINSRRHCLALMAFGQSHDVGDEPSPKKRTDFGTALSRFFKGLAAD